MNKYHSAKHAESRWRFPIAPARPCHPFRTQTAARTIRIPVSIPAVHLKFTRPGWCLIFCMYTDAVMYFFFIHSFIHSKNWFLCLCRSVPVGAILSLLALATTPFLRHYWPCTFNQFWHQARKKVAPPVEQWMGNGVTSRQPQTSIRHARTFILGVSFCLYSVVALVQSRSLKLQILTPPTISRQIQ